MIRTFVAVELDARLREALVSVQTAIKRQLSPLLADARVQWVRPDGFHLTLKFLGATDEARVEPTLQALAGVVHGREAFAVDVQHIGVFPDRHAPRVLWVGMGGAVHTVVDLAGAVEEGLIAMGWEPEERPFRPHLTLARIKENARQVGKALAGAGVLETGQHIGTLQVDAVALIQSQLGPDGARYTKLGQVSLESRRQ